MNSTTDVKEPARLISPAPAVVSEGLPARINAATRQVHTALNKLVTSRVSLAVPPHNTDPTLYLYGIDTFAQLYFTFEDAWQDLICEHLAVSSPYPSAKSTASPRETSSTDLHSHAVRSLLSTLVPPTLWRTDRLERDISYLQRLTKADLPRTQDDELVQELVSHIKHAVETRPHVLLAYSWVLYMAIFSGGRWIRAQLQAAGSAFWGHEEKQGQKRVQEQGISLFYFDGPEDGEDIKRFYKEKLSMADPLLSEAEKSDVILEASWIFEACTRLVHHLDEKLATSSTMKGDGKSKDTTIEQGRGEDARIKADGIPEAMRKYLPPPSHNPTLYPGSYATAGLDSFATMLAIALGIGGWYILHVYGVVGRGMLSNMTSFEL